MSPTRAEECEPERGVAAPPASLPAPRHGPPDPLAESDIDPAVRRALAEDLGAGDVTSAWTIPSGRRAKGTLVVKADGRLAGLAVFARAFLLSDPRASVHFEKADGAPVRAGEVAAEVRGDARALLAAERTALNFVQRLSGIATLTARYVAHAGPGVRILDTRKTTPGLRLLEKYAVRCGGGENHRFGLFDEAMIKSNHLALAGESLATLVSAVRAGVGPRVRVTAEARTEAEALAAIRGGADVVLLDNFAPDELARLCPRLRRAAEGRAVLLEASGGIDLGNVQAFARAGLDRLSVGALTHSAPALDLALRLELLE